MLCYNPILLFQSSTPGSVNEYYLTKKIIVNYNNAAKEINNALLIIQHSRSYEFQPIEWWFEFLCKWSSQVWM